MNEEDITRDLTSFLLEWRDTCAIDLCPERKKGGAGYTCKYRQEGESDEAYVARIREDVAHVHRLADARFKALVERPRTPDKVGLAKKLEDAEKAASESTDGLPDESSVREIPDGQGGEESGDEDDAIQPDDFRPAPDRDPASGKTLGAALADESNFSQDKRDTDKDPAPAPVYGASQPLRGQMVSEYLDLVRSWVPGEKRRTHAFHVLELFLYDMREISGRPFKSHLFDVIAANGVGPVWGYLYKRVMSSMATKSFRTVTGAGDDIGSTSQAPDPTDTWNAGRAGANQAGVNEAADALYEWTTGRWPQFDINDKLALLCTIFEVSMNDPRVVAMTTVGRQAFYNRKALARNALEFLYGKGFKKDEILKLLAGPFQDILLKIAGQDPACKPFLDFLKKTAAEAGK